MDMIGRMQNNKLIVVGSGTSPAWNSLLDEVNGTARFDMARSESGFGASDQQSFYAAKVPVLFFFTGLHADYHKPSDTADKINVEDQTRVVNLVAECATRIANSSERPAYQQIAVPQENAPARFRVSLGSIPDYASQVEGVQLSGVRPGSPAEKAGLKAGDIIIKFGGRTIRNVQEYTIALTDHKPGDDVEIVVKRGNETVTVKASLAGSSR
jgi:aminopeptidase YwaD